MTLTRYFSKWEPRAEAIFHFDIYRLQDMLLYSSSASESSSPDTCAFARSASAMSLASASSSVSVTALGCEKGG